MKLNEQNFSLPRWIVDQGVHTEKEAKAFVNSSGTGAISKTRRIFVSAFKKTSQDEKVSTFEQRYCDPKAFEYALFSILSEATKLVTIPLKILKKGLLQFRWKENVKNSNMPIKHTYDTKSIMPKDLEARYRKMYPLDQLVYRVYVDPWMLSGLMHQLENFLSSDYPRGERVVCLEFHREGELPIVVRAVNEKTGQRVVAHMGAMKSNMFGVSGYISKQAKQVKCKEGGCE